LNLIKPYGEQIVEKKYLISVVGIHGTSRTA